MTDGRYRENRRKVLKTGKPARPAKQAKRSPSNPPTILLSDPPQLEVLYELVRKYPDVDLAALLTLLAFVSTSTKLLSTMEAHFSRYGLSQGRFALLMILLSAGEEAVSPSELAKRAGVTPATITSLVDGLEKGELVKREPDPLDRRGLRIRLTAKGRKFFEKMLPDHLRRVSVVGSVFSGKDHEAFRGLLRLFESGLEKMNEANSDQPQRAAKVVVVRK